MISNGDLIIKPEKLRCLLALLALTFMLVFLGFN